MCLESTVCALCYDKQLVAIAIWPEFAVYKMASQPLIMTADLEIQL